MGFGLPSPVMCAARPRRSIEKINAYTEYGANYY